MDKSRSLWNAETERRLIELARRERPLEEIAREISLPVDVIRARLNELFTEHGEIPRY